MSVKYQFPPSAIKKRDDELFDDFTSVTDWERFMQALENILTRWGLNADGDPFLSELLLSTSTPTNSGYCCGLLEYGEREFALVCHNSSDEALHGGADEEEKTVKRAGDLFHAPFQSQSASKSVVFNGSNAAPLSWFGLRHVLILRPVYGDITGQTRLNQLLSSVEMVVHSTRCRLPILIEYAESPVQYHGVAAIPPLTSSNATTTEASAGFDLVDRSAQWSSYTTSQLAGALNVDFATACFPAASDGVLPICTHLSGLRECFLAKLGYPWKFNCPPPEIHIAARFIYEVQGLTSPVCVPPQTFPMFSFSEAAVSSASVRLYFSALWDEVPGYAITERPSPCSLQPEGASEWRFQALIRRLCPDILSLLIRHLVRSCSENSTTTANDRQKITTYTSQSLRQSWLGADLPRLKGMLGRESLPTVDDLDPVMEPSPAPVHLTGESILQYLLFLFPDADPQFTCSKCLEKELQTGLSTSSHGPDDFTWRRINVRLSPEIKALTSHLGLPALTGLSHRLAVLLANLHCQETVANSGSEAQDDHRLVRTLLAEFLLELQLRLDRGIRLPSPDAFFEADLAVEACRGVCDGASPSGCLQLTDMSVLRRPPLVTRYQRQTATGYGTRFTEWTDTQCLDLQSILARFDVCIARPGSVSTPGAESELHEVDQLVEDEFFDACETVDRGDSSSQLSGSVFSEASPLEKDKMSPAPGGEIFQDLDKEGEAMQEGRLILAWLRSLDYSQVLCLLLPSVCLEAITVFHSLVPNERLVTWYRRELDRLDCAVYSILTRLSVEREDLDGYENVRERYCETYSEALRLLANFGKRLTCFKELLLVYTNSNQTVSDEVLSFLCDLSSRACCDVDQKHLRWRPHFPGWLPVSKAMAKHLSSSFWTGFQQLTRPTDLTRTSFSQIAGVPVESRQPRWESYVLRTATPRPSPLASRRGPQQLMVQLGFGRDGAATSQRYDDLLMAGAFSHDTQFF